MELRQEKIGNVDPTALAGYCGHYKLSRNLVVTVTRDGGRLFVHAAGQPRLELFPETDRDFFAKMADVQLAFITDKHGRAIQLVLNQNGAATPATRIDEAAARQIEDDIEKRRQAQTPAPGTEAALRRTIEELRSGQPNYDLMSPMLAAVTRQRLPDARALIGRLGSVVSTAFEAIGPEGADAYEVKFANGPAECRILLDDDGKVDLFGIFAKTPPTTDASPSSRPQPSRLSEAGAIAAIRGELQAATDAGRFAGAVMIGKDGAPVFQAAYGYADLESRTPNEIETKFRIGSMNKMFTAVAVLQLVQAGKVRLADPIGHFLTDYPNQNVASKVTVDHLLSHTGGTGDIFGPEFQAHRRELRELKDYTALYGARDLAFEPGSRWSYSNYGFVLLGALIEQVTGQSYYDYVGDHVQMPAGMTATGSLPETAGVPGLSTGYVRSGSKVLPNTDTLPYRGTSAGGGYSTVGDLIRFATALTSHKLIDRDYTDLATTGRVDMEVGKYGYGFFDRTQNGVRYYGHDGGALGMNGDLRVFPRSHYVVAVLSNLDPPAASRIAEFASDRLPER